jgi:hypothetical protein
VPGSRRVLLGGLVEGLQQLAEGDDDLADKI